MYLGELIRQVLLDQGISKYYTTQVAPSRVETLREIAKSVKYEIGSKIPGDAKTPKSRDRGSLQAGNFFDTYFFNLLCVSGNFKQEIFFGNFFFVRVPPLDFTL